MIAQPLPTHMPSGSLLEFGSDKPLRNRWFVPESFAHPAKCHLGLLVKPVQAELWEVAS